MINEIDSRPEFNHRLRSQGHYIAGLGHKVSTSLARGDYITDRGQLAVTQHSLCSGNEAVVVVILF